MAHTVAPFSGPLGADPFDPAGIKGNDDALRAFVNNHKASHWSFLFSAPLTSQFTFTPTTGGSLVAGATHYLRVTYLTKNGETIASSQISVALGGGQNAIQITFPQTDTELVQKVRVYLAASGAGSGTTCYRVAEVTLSGSGTVQATILNYAADTSNPHPTSNSSGSQDPLSLLMAPYPRTTTITDSAPSAGYFQLVETFTVAGVTVVITTTYDKAYSPARMAATNAVTVKANGMTLMRFNATFGTNPVTGTSYLTALTQQEA